MKPFRKYGKKPAKIVVLHGGPGAAGSVIDIANQLSKYHSVLEPFQTRYTINAQVDELKEQIANHCDLPIILIGWSWGAWLGYIFASKFPSKVKKLILISSGPFEEKYVDQMLKERISRFSKSELIRLKELEELMQNNTHYNRDKLFSEFGKLYEKADNYKSIENDPNIIVNKQKPNSEIYNKVWPKASEMRKSGRLINFAKNIKCQVTAIHGDYDPHPANGVKVPLKKIIKNFKFILIKKCGHEPWLEKNARDKFYKILREEIV